MKYKGNFSKTLKRKLKGSGLKLVSKKQTALENIFAKKFKYKTNTGTNIVYQIPCKCGEIYIGQTCFNLQKRLNEHKSYVKKKLKTSGIYLHTQKCNLTIDWDNSKVLKQITDQNKRMVAEALYIQKLNPTMNITDGLVLKDKWNW